MEVTKISRENLEVVFTKVTYHLNVCDYEGCVKFKLLDKATQNTLFTGTYNFDKCMIDVDDIVELYLENNGIEVQDNYIKLCARYYKKALKEYKENLEENFWYGTDADVAEWLKDYFIRDWDEQEVCGYYFTGNKRKKVHYVHY